MGGAEGDDTQERERVVAKESGEVAEGVLGLCQGGGEVVGV